MAKLDFKFLSKEHLDKILKMRKPYEEQLSPVQPLGVDVRLSDYTSDYPPSDIKNAYEPQEQSYTDQKILDNGGDWIILDEDRDEDDFIDISDEAYRHYIFDDKRYVMIINPQELYVCDHAHTIIDNEGVWHTVPYGWVVLEREMING